MCILTSSVYILETFLFLVFRVSLQVLWFKFCLMAAWLFGGTNGIGFLNPKTFHLFTSRWRASELIKSLPASDLPQVRAKVAAMEMLKGQRADLGLQRAWEGNYLASVRTGQQTRI